MISHTNPSIDPRSWITSIVMSYVWVGTQEVPFLKLKKLSSVSDMVLISKLYMYSTLHTYQNTCIVLYMYNTYYYY